MARMLSTSGQCLAHAGPLVYGLPVKPRRSRRIGRAREERAWRKEMAT